jgi:hypothetical protein
MRILLTIGKELLNLPTRIVYMFRYWEYVDWRFQTLFYSVLIIGGVLWLAWYQGLL